MLGDYLKAVDSLFLPNVRGRIIQVIGLVIESRGPQASMGELCHICQGTQTVGLAEVVGFREGVTLLMSLTPMDDMRPGMDVQATGERFKFKVGPGVLGRVLDGLGQPMDGKGPVEGDQFLDLLRAPPNPLSRARIQKPLGTGIRSIDGFRTIARGQRMGIFSGSGVGKSVLMGMISRYCEADINVIALIGERGREVREFLEKDLGEEGLKRSVVVVSTSDQPGIVRVKAAFLATSIAEYFRDQGKDVMLMMDSSTRIALAQREIGLASGEPPTTRGYPPSVFAMLPRLFERAGMSSIGSITGLYTVLVEGDDLDEPISDAVRSILDGHIVLSRALANRNHFPAVDILKSVSRCMTDVINDDHKKLLKDLLPSMALYEESEDMISLGAYAKGTNPQLDKAINRHPLLENFLIQAIEDQCDFKETMTRLKSLAGGGGK